MLLCKTWIFLGFGNFHLLLLVSCGICLMIVIVESLSIGFILPFIEADCILKPNLNEKGALNGAAYLGIVVSSHFWGYIADTKGRKKAMKLCSGLTFLSSSLSSLSVTICMLIIARFFVGVLWVFRRID